MNSLAKGPKKNDDKSAVAMLKKYELHDRTVQPVVDRDMKVLENTPGMFCDENGHYHEWINGQKPHLIRNGIRIQCNTENFVPIVVPGLSTSSSSGSYHSNFKDTFKTGEALFYIFFKLVSFTYNK